MESVITFETARQLDRPCFIDVRSPREFETGHIYQAINLPVMDNLTHEAVGTLYKKVSPQAAKARAIRYMSDQLPLYFNRVQRLMADYQLVFYCKSGGFRSSSIFGLLTGLGEPVYQLKGGYKAYRNYSNNTLSTIASQFDFVCLNGLTGTGKTEILHQLKRMGQQVLDLEAIACHRGSHFGHVGLPAQPSQKNYEAHLLHILQSFDQKLVFLEGESASIGKVHTPLPLLEAYQSSPHQVFIESSLSLRIHRIQSEYLKPDQPHQIEDLIQTLESMDKMNPDRRQQAINKLKEGDSASVIEDLMVHYYDPHYHITKKQFELSLDNSDSTRAAQELIRFYS